MQADIMYKRYVGRKKYVFIVLLLILFILSFLALNLGASRTTLINLIGFFRGINDQDANLILWRIRLPRILAAIVAGAALSISGCIMQNNLKNPLASPFTLGISNAAAFGANVAIILLDAGSTQSSTKDAVIINNPYIVSICAFVFSIFATFIVIKLAKLKFFSKEAIVLSGVALGSLFTAATTLIQYFAQDYQVAAAVFWTFGDLGRVSYKEVLIMATATLISYIYFYVHRWDYNTLEASDDVAKSLGVDVEKLRLRSLLLVSFATATAVSFIGVIGFIGLIAPHIMRRIVGSDLRFLIPTSTVLGSVLLLLSDTLARTIISPIVLPVGVITSFLGAPLFLYLLIKGEGRG
ncbi:FecCD family ABC transporter permease [Thermobrachium celere]|uniref:Iron(III) dicitrate transport system permease protein n=1 Tax=Thermobrachium celere DSM 8682 TaxID=941824 RepID=R7RQ02_9CLOT|nr:iron ABC transporter permease [Thermobrachium celere]CDF57383.1 Iron(III) dicitrate transport system permease protein [Thermobrachium celere DSM 8682]